MSASTDLPRKPAMLSLDEAIERLLAQVRPPAPERAESVSTFDALGRVLAEDVRSLLDVPPEDNSEMDGYALRVADVAQPGMVLRVSQRIAAGRVGTALEPGSAARIFTGAQVPAGADAVVMQELCTPVDGGVRIDASPAPGQSIRRRGEDVCRDATVLRAGLRLGPQALGMAASVGAATLKVGRHPRVALFSTGDELAMPGDVLKPGAIYNSNRFTLRGLIQAMGGVCEDLGIVPDRLDATREMLRRPRVCNDRSSLCGGMSVGEEDHVKPAVEQGGRSILWQIAIAPKPLPRRVPAATARGWFIGLPGNPVSAFVTFLFAVPGASPAAGGEGPAPADRDAADFAWPRADRRREFLRVRRNAGGGLDLFPNQGSAVLTSTTWGDGLVDNPGGMTIAPGDSVRYLPFAELLT